MKRSFFESREGRTVAGLAAAGGVLIGAGLITTGGFSAKSGKQSADASDSSARSSQQGAQASQQGAQAAQRALDKPPTTIAPTVTVPASPPPNNPTSSDSAQHSHFSISFSLRRRDGDREDGQRASTLQQ